MFWQFLIATAIGIGLIHLGALSVWVVVLKAMLLVVLVVALLAGLLFIWRRYKDPQGD